MPEFVELITQAIDFVLHVDKHLEAMIPIYGNWMYLILFLIIFCETGLVITPFLPGDSLLFFLGILCGAGLFNIFTLIVILIIAAFLGNFVNYQIGRYLGPKVFDPEKFKFINKKYLIQTQQYFEKHGKMTVFLSRFAPIIRTFVPFVAGVGKMNYGKFITSTLLGGIVWVTLFIIGGYFLGQFSIVKDNVSKIAIIIIFVSLIPAALAFVKRKK